MRVEVLNVPEYADAYKYIVASVSDNDLWFYGAFNDLREAHKVANKISPAVVLANEEARNGNK